MKRSLVSCALILLVAALLGWRETQALSRKQKANARLVTEAEAIPNADAPAPKAPPIPINRSDRRQAELAMQVEVKALARDYFALFRDYDGNSGGQSSEEFAQQKANIKSRLEALDPSSIRQFMGECYSSPDLNLRIERDINFYVRTVFISKYPLEMATMMSNSPELFGINEKATSEGYVQDPFQHLVYYYSYEKKDLQLVFQCLTEASPAFQSKYIGGTLDHYADSPPKRAELLVAMRDFASTPEQVELVNSKLSALVFGRSEAKPTFIEVSDWIGSANLSGDELVAATRDMQDRVRVGETGQWLDWLAKVGIPDKLSKERAFQLVSKWTEKDYQAAGKWLNSAPESAAKSAAVSAYAAKAYPYDPEGAIQWIQTLPQGPDRTKALQTIYLGMQEGRGSKYDREVVEAFARKHGLRD
jgi:hypothetical protein